MVPRRARTNVNRQQVTPPRQRKRGPALPVERVSRPVPAPIPTRQRKRGTAFNPIPNAHVD
jgi:hypothetical protein